MATACLGQHPLGYGLFVAKPGYDVLSCGDANMLFSMNGDFSRVLAQGTTTFGANTTGTINIALSGTGGYIPLVQCYTVVQSPTGGQVTCISYSYMNYQITSSNLAITLTQNVTANLIVTYIVFVDNLST
jgi:hypothetical protein